MSTSKKNVEFTRKVPNFLQGLVSARDHPSGKKKPGDEDEPDILPVIVELKTATSTSADTDQAKATATASPTSTISSEAKKEIEKHKAKSNPDGADSKKRPAKEDKPIGNKKLLSFEEED